MTKEKRAHCINTIIPNLKKAGVTLPDLQMELNYREENSVLWGRFGADDRMTDYSTGDLDNAETLWDLNPEGEMRYEVLKLLKNLIERRYGNLEDERGCCVNGAWLSVAAIVELIDRVDKNAVEG